MGGEKRQITVGGGEGRVEGSSDLQVRIGAALAGQRAACCPSRQSILGCKRHQHRGSLRSLYSPFPKGGIHT